MLRAVTPAEPFGLASCSLPKGEREREKAAILPNLPQDIGDPCVYGVVVYYFRILLPILKPASEYLSVLHQIALLTPKYGLWENLIACSEWHWSRESDKVVDSHFVIMGPNGKETTEWMHEWMNEHTLGLFIQGSGGNAVMSSLKHLWGLRPCKDSRQGQSQENCKSCLHTDPPVSGSGVSLRKTSSSLCPQGWTHSRDGASCGVDSQESETIAMEGTHFWKPWVGSAVLDAELVAASLERPPP